MDAIEELLTRGVENIIPGGEGLRKLLESGRKLNVYLGIDPTSTKIHIGHAVPLRKLNAFAELGHHVTFLIGDFTALIGDTSDKDSERPQLTSNEIEENFRTYKKQAEKVLDFSKITVRYNSEWLRKLGFEDIVRLCQHFSTGDFVSRELIKKRLSEGKRVGLHELLYPVMQGYDSYFMDTDIQLGGTDQTFNMQAGRVLQKDLRGKESYIIANGFLEGTDGRKMSKTWGNAIWLDDEPDEMYGKIMSLKDELIVSYFTLATSVSMDRINNVKTRLEQKENPMILKRELAFEIVKELHGETKAQLAAEKFDAAFVKKDIEAIAMQLPVQSLAGKNTVSAALLAQSIVKSKSEFKSLLNQGAIDVNGSTINQDVEIKQGDIIKTGKRKVIKIV